MNNQCRAHRLLIVSLATFLSTGGPGARAFAAPAASIETEKETGEKQNLDDVLEAHRRCQDGTIDLLGTKGVAQAAKFQALTDRGVQDSLKLYEACLSPVPGYEKSCSLLANLKNGTADCREYSVYAGMLSAIFNSGDARAACEPFDTAPGRAWRAKSGQPRNKEKHARMCDFLIAALKRGSQNICAEAKAGGIISDERMPECQLRMIYLLGVPDRCAADPDKDDQILCREKATLLAALRSKNFQTCALSPWCRAVTGRRAESCDPYLVRANKAFCDQVAKTAVPVLKAKAERDAKIAEMKAREKKKFTKNSPMQLVSPEVKKAMQKIERNEPPTAAPPQPQAP